MLPDDRDYTETCRNIFNVNFNISFKAKLLCFSWQIKTLIRFRYFCRTSCSAFSVTSLTMEAAKVSETFRPHLYTKPYGGTAQYTVLSLL